MSSHPTTDPVVPTLRESLGRALADGRNSGSLWHGDGVAALDSEFSRLASMVGLVATMIPDGAGTPALVSQLDRVADHLDGVGMSQRAAGLRIHARRLGRSSSPPPSPSHVGGRYDPESRRATPTADQVIDQGIDALGVWQINDPDLADGGR